jgi:sugar fermentation stimulation protein A
MLYLIQRENCNFFKIADKIDIEYKKAFLSAKKKGIKILCYNCKLSPQEIKVNKPVEIL